MKYILFILLLSVRVVYAQYSLALNLEKNSVYHLKINSTNQFSGEMDGHKVIGSYQMMGAMNFKVVEVSSTGYVLEAGYDSIHFVIRSPMGKFEFNSADENEGMSYTPIMDRHIKLTILKNCSIKKIENEDTSGLFSIIRNNPMVSGLKRMLMMGAFRHSVSKDVMKDNMEKLTAIFPEKKVNLNETWGSVVKLDSASNNMVRTTYQLVSYQGGIAVIKGHTETVTASSDHQNQGIFPAMMPKYQMQGQTESVIEINSVTGWVNQATVKNVMKGHIQMTQPNKQTKESPVQINSDTKISSY